MLKRKLIKSIERDRSGLNQGALTLVPVEIHCSVTIKLLYNKQVARIVCILIVKLIYCRAKKYIRETTTQSLDGTDEFVETTIYQIVSL